jgi:hypothetical protein
MEEKMPFKRDYREFLFFNQLIDFVNGQSNVNLCKHFNILTKIEGLDQHGMKILAINKINMHTYVIRHKDFRITMYLLMAKPINNKCIYYYIHM